MARTADGRLSIRLDSSPDQQTGPAEPARQKPQARLSNLCGLIDPAKLAALVAAGGGPGVAGRGVRGRGQGRLGRLELAGLAGLSGLLLLVIAMASPAWLASWADTASPFVRLGPWQVCYLQCFAMY